MHHRKMRHNRRGGNSQWIVHATRIYQATTLKNPSSKHARPNCVLRQRAIDEHVTQTQQTKTWKKSRPLHSSNCATYSGRPNNSHAMFNQRIPSNIVSNRRPWRIWRHGRGRHGFGTDRQRQQTSTRTSKLRSNVQRTAAKDASYNSTTSIHATSCCTTILGMASATQTLGINDPTRRWAKPLQEMKRRPTTHASNHAHSTHRRNWSWQNRPWWAEGDTPCQEPVDNVGYCELKCATHGGTAKPMQRTRTDETNWSSEHASMSTHIWWTPASNTTCLATRPQLQTHQSGLPLILIPRTPTSWTCRPDPAEIQAHRNHVRPRNHAINENIRAAFMHDDGGQQSRADEAMGKNIPSNSKSKLWTTPWPWVQEDTNKTTRDEHNQRLQQSTAHVLLAGGFLSAKKNQTKATCAAGSA